MSRQQFIKSASTRTPVGNSRAQLERMLLRYGCDGYGTETDYRKDKLRIWFSVRDEFDNEQSPMVPIKIEIDIRNVARAMGTNSIERAERVAWRQVILWVDAACSASAAGVQRMSDAFFAHTIIAVNGSTRRLTDHLNDQAGGDWRALLAPPTES